MSHFTGNTELESLASSLFCKLERRRRRPCKTSLPKNEDTLQVGRGLIDTGPRLHQNKHSVAKSYLFLSSRVFPPLVRCRRKNTAQLLSLRNEPKTRGSLGETAIWRRPEFIVSSFHFISPLREPARAGTRVLSMGNAPGSRFYRHIREYQRGMAMCWNTV